MITMSQPGGNTKKRLIKAALRVFTEKGFAGASTREIVEASGVTKPTLYYYFGSKDNLYRSLLKESFERFNKEIGRITAEYLPPRKKLLKIVSYYLNYSKTSPREIKLIMISIYRSDSAAPEVDLAEYARPGIEAIAGVIRDGMKTGAFKKGNQLQLSLQLIGMIHIQILLILNDEGTLHLSRPEEIIATFLEGIARR